MNHDSAELIVRIGAIAGWCVWLISVWFFRAMARREPIVSRETTSEHVLAEARKTCLRGFAAQPQWRIIERTATTVAAVMMRVKIIVALQEITVGTQCRVQVDFRRLDRMFTVWMRLILFGLAPLALVGVPELLLRFAVGSGIPEIQWQAVQIIQLVHVLWPPFLLYAMHAHLRGYCIRVAETLQLLLEIAA